MTEGDAKRKWCPFVRLDTGHSGRVAHNRDRSHPAQTTCMASACMAWRWVMDDDLPLGAGETMKPTGNGYCGLAGHP